MTENYYVYKLYNNDYPEFYIGSTTDIVGRRRCHKYNCTNSNSKHYNLKLYKYIRDHGGYSNWSYEILEHITTTINKYELQDLERKAIEDMKPSLNTQLPNRSKNEYMEKYRENYKQHINEKFICECGGKYTRSHKARHEQSKKHCDFIN